MKEGMHVDGLDAKRAGAAPQSGKESGAGQDFGNDSFGSEGDGVSQESQMGRGSLAEGASPGLDGQGGGIFSNGFGEALLSAVARETGIQVAPSLGGLALKGAADLAEEEARWADPESDDDAEAAAENAREGAKRWAVAEKLALCLAKAGADVSFSAAGASAAAFASSSAPGARSASDAPRDPGYEAKARFYSTFLASLLRPHVRSCPQLYRRYPEEVVPPFLAVQLVALGFARTEADADSQGSVCTDFDSLRLAAPDLELVLEELKDCGLALDMAQELMLFDLPRDPNEKEVAAEGFYLQADTSRSSPQRHPFVIDPEGRRIYFERRFAEEMKLALAVSRYAAEPEDPVGGAAAGALAAFKAEDARRGWTDEDHDRAVAGALKRRFTVITGGPGTGKTTVVVRILACLLAENPGLVIGGAAPTGKAASNLSGSIEGALRGMEKGGGVLSELGGLVSRANVRCQTLHQWLSGKNGSERPSAASPLALDILVVDECSMMDIGLAVQLFEALSSSRTRVILLGDKDQLAAVGPGSVFADLSDTKGALAPWIYSFTKSHRFSSGSRLYRLAKAVTPESDSEGDAGVVMAALSESQSMDGDAADNAVLWVKPSRGAGDRASGGAAAGSGVTPALQDWLMAEYRPLFERFKSAAGLPVAEAKGSGAIGEAGAAENSGAALFWKRISQVGVLSSRRSGVNGTNAVNDFMEARVREAAGVAPDARHYPGRLVLVTRNAWSLGLANGDTGVELPDGRGGLSVFFGGRVEAIPVALLPEHESAFAITIHKSQGSSYHRLAVCLPDAVGGKLCSRELLYTAVTRLADVGGVKGAMALFASESAVREAVGRRVKRFSGLADRLSMLIGRSRAGKAQQGQGVP